MHHFVSTVLITYLSICLAGPSIFTNNSNSVTVNVTTKRKSKHHYAQETAAFTQSRDHSLQYSLIDEDVPATRSTASSDTLCAAICHPSLLETCNFDSACLNKLSLQKDFQLSICLKLCTSNATNTVDIATLKKSQLTAINTFKRSKKSIDSRIQTKLNNKKFLWATAIVRNSAQKLLEWIVWHFLMGVQHFLIYDNASVDNIASALKPFIEANIVTMIPNVRDIMQIKAYNHALHTAKLRKVHWLMLLDVDEFVMTSTTHSLLDLLLNHSLTPTVGAVQLQWQLLVPPKRGFLFKPLNITFLELLSDNFAMEGYTHPRCSTKSIVKVDLTVEAHVHHGKFYQNISATDSSFSPTSSSGAAGGSIRGIDVFGRPVDSPWAKKPWYVSQIY
jgi:hypothetical protein